MTAVLPSRYQPLTLREANTLHGSGGWFDAYIPFDERVEHTQWESNERDRIEHRLVEILDEDPEFRRILTKPDGTPDDDLWDLLCELWAPLPNGRMECAEVMKRRRLSGYRRKKKVVIA